MQFRSQRTLLWAVAIAGLLSLLGVLASFQFRWINAVTTAERERMQAHLQAATQRLVQEFDRELIRACLIFLVAPFEWREGNWPDLMAHYQLWSQTAVFPKLVRTVYLASGQAQEAPKIYRFDPRSNQLVAEPWPSRFSLLRKRLEARREPKRQAPSRATSPAQWTIEEQIPALVLFVSQVAPHRPSLATPPAAAGQGSPRFLGGLILELDREFLQKELLPHLVPKHLSGPGGFDYDIAIAPAGDPEQFVYLSTGASQSSFRSPDVNVALFALRPEDANAMSATVALRRTETAGRGSRRGGGPRADWPPYRGRGLALQSILPGVEGRWRLLVTHRSGSLESAVAGLRTRNLAVSFAILLILGAGIGLIVVLTQRAQKLARAQSEFLAGISHELLTPLAVIRAAADNLADAVAVSGEQAQRYGEIVRRQSRRLSEMLQDALGFAVAQNVARRRFRAVAVEDVIRRAIETCGPAIAEAGVTLVEDIEPKLPPVQGDATALSHALRNLLMNGIQYGSEGAWLSIAARQLAGRNGREIEITVEDRGPGIEPRDLPRIFEPFFRGRTAAAVRLHGTGLGLSLVKRIADDHHGRISVKPAHPKGTVFSLRLPVASSPDTENEA
jgi:signal transduction histidine kinase